MKYFIDTSFIIALESVSDVNHLQSLIIWNNLHLQTDTYLITDYILDEILTFFNTKGFHNKAIEIVENIQNSAKIEILQIDKKIFDNAFQFLKKSKDKTYSFTDCTSFVIMHKNKISNALSFDKHFIQAGFIIKNFP
jgi:uncharacterized protein